MMTPRVVYSPRYAIDLGLHVFPTEKYRLVHDALIRGGLVSSSDVVEPPAATWEELSLVHTAEYVQKMRDGALTPEDVAQLELPWSQAMVDGFRVMVGGTIQAARIACGLVQVRSTKYEVGNSSPAGASTDALDVVLQTSYLRQAACHLGGGHHHAFPKHGEGF